MSDSGPAALPGRLQVWGPGESPPGPGRRPEARPDHRVAVTATDRDGHGTGSDSAQLLRPGACHSYRVRGTCPSQPRLPADGPPGGGPPPAASQAVHHVTPAGPGGRFDSPPWAGRRGGSQRRPYAAAAVAAPRHELRVSVRGPRRRLAPRRRAFAAGPGGRRPSRIPGPELTLRLQPGPPRTLGSIGPGPPPPPQERPRLSQC